MKIESNGNDIQRIEQVRAVRPAQATNAAQAAGRVGGADQAQFSTRGVDLAKARAALSAVPEVREDRVASLRSQVQSGTYQIPTEALAAKLMRAIAG